jgi:hypothetical protein
MLRGGRSENTRQTDHLSSPSETDVIHMKHLLPKLAALSLACLTALPACCLAAEAAQPAQAEPLPQVVDVALGGGGLLRGQVVDTQGAPLKDTPVSVWFANHQVATTTADENGQFSVSGLRGGVHQVVAGQGSGVYRLWTAEAAPPTAKSGTLIIPGQTVVRGQNGYPVRSILQSPVREATPLAV